MSRPRWGPCPVKVPRQSMNRTEELFIIIGADSFRKIWIRWPQNQEDRQHHVLTLNRNLSGESLNFSISLGCCQSGEESLLGQEPERRLV
ncbi:hypothetical protein E2C01_045662 [Portunus trituberculatus]|uniref:Uncharacterized protein n=1 Tax=Portunus trituberculatus TaxID=210409 RepID=A0A5B7G3R7_PORTR|nr:hypothetical protein [Portunus trituberculatus]